MPDSRISDSVGRRRGVAAEELRRHNLSAVLDRIHIAGPLSRSHLAVQTGLNRSTIRDLIKELVDLGLVLEGPGATGQGPGRPSSVARPSPRGAVVLSVELAVDSLAVATIGLGGHIFDKIRLPHPEGRAGSPEMSIDTLGALIPGLLEGLPIGHHLVGVGVAVAGVVHRSDGFIHVAPNLGWEATPLGEIIAARWGLPRVMLANEADMGALGEYRRGAARHSRHFIFIAGEVGLGLGIILEGKPMLGSAGYAGEAGHVIVNPGGRHCRCGSIGCWETEVGEEALLRRAGLSRGVEGARSVEEIVARAQERDTQTLEALDETGRWLGIGIGNLINTFNPDLVVVGGFYQQIYSFMEDTTRETARDTSLAAAWGAAEITVGMLGSDAQLIGAAELVLGEVISDPATFRPRVEPSSA